MKRFYKLNLKIIKNQKGFTLAEVAMAVLLLSIFITFGYKGIDVIMRDIRTTQTYNAKTTLVANLLNTLVTDSKSLQVDYTASDANELLVDETTFKNAWELDGTISKLDECPKCKGRFAYVVKPIYGNKQMNMLTIKVYHPSFTGENKIRTYKRIIGTR